MADTERTLTDLLTNLFQDGQGAASITPQDMRDLIVSLGKLPFGSVTQEANVTATTISSTGVYTVLAGAFVAGTVDDMTADVNGRLTYTGMVERHVHLSANPSFTVAGSNKVISFKIAKNGAVIGAPAKRKVGTGSDIGNLYVTADAPMVTNDYFELWVANVTDTSDVTVEDMELAAMGLAI